MGCPFQNGLVPHLSKKLSKLPLSDCLVSYAGHSLRESYPPPTEMQLMYSIAAADWATLHDVGCTVIQGMGSHGVTVIVIGNGYGDLSSNPGQSSLHFT